MNSPPDLRRVVAGAAIALLVGGAVPAGAGEHANAALERLRKSDCDGVLDPLNRGLQAREPKAQYVLGYMHLNGVCLAANPARGEALLESAAKAGDEDAAKALVLAHGLGRGLPQDYERAGVWARVWTDLLAQAAAGRLTGPPSRAASAAGAAASPPTPDQLRGLGQSTTIQILAEQRFLARRPLLSEFSGIANLEVVIASGSGKEPPRASVKLRDITGSQKHQSIRPRESRDLQDMVRDLQADFDAAIQQVPPLSAGGSVETVRQYGFSVE